MKGRLVFLAASAIVMAACGCNSAHESSPRAQGAGDGPDVMLDGEIGAGDAGDEASCVGDWPSVRLGQIEDSIDGSVGMVVWSRRLAWRGLHVEVAFDGQRIALGAGNKLWLMDTSGKVVGEFLDADAQLGSAPISDGTGNFLFASNDVRSIDADGVVRWVFPLGENIARGQDTTSVSQIVLSPQGRAYFAATDGFLYALDVRNGAAVWRREIGLREDGGCRIVGLGIGDTIFVDGEPYDVTTGVVGRTPHVGGDTVKPIMANSAFLIASNYTMVGSGYRSYVWLLDKCGRGKMSVCSVESSCVVDLVGFDDTLWVRSVPASTRLLSSAGDTVGGPKALNGWSTSMGADGIVYNTSCSSSDPATSSLRIVAYDQSLEQQWSLDLGPPCTYGGTALGEDGMLYLAREDHTGIEVIAVKTSSPGLADTPWPTRLQNNRRTAWLAH